MTRAWWPGRTEWRTRPDREKEARMAGKAGRRWTWVNCPDCGWVSMEEVEFLGIEEGFDGRDVETFRCGCGPEVRKSVVVGGSRPG